MDRTEINPLLSEMAEKLVRTTIKSNTKFVLPGSHWYFLCRKSASIVEPPRDAPCLNKELIPTPIIAPPTMEPAIEGTEKSENKWSTEVMADNKEIETIVRSVKERPMLKKEKIKNGIFRSMNM